MDLKEIALIKVKANSTHLHFSRAQVEIQPISYLQQDTVLIQIHWSLLDNIRHYYQNHLIAIINVSSEKHKDGRSNKKAGY